MKAYKVINIIFLILNSMCIIGLLLEPILIPVTHWALWILALGLNILAVGIGLYNRDNLF